METHIAHDVYLPLRKQSAKVGKTHGALHSTSSLVLALADKYGQWHAAFLQLSLRHALGSSADASVLSLPTRTTRERVDVRNVACESGSMNDG